MSRQELERSRQEKLACIAAQGNPYPERFELSHALCEAAALADGEYPVRVAGRILLLRRMGKLTFLTLSDAQGRLQVALKSDSVGEQAYDFWKKALDVGDFVGVQGEMFTTRTGEKTLRAEQMEFLGKALRPLPEKFHGLRDVESCYRQRYLDLMMNEETAQRFIFKSCFMREVRRFLEERGYLEIETPVLLDKPSGALARPFHTHHNALDLPITLRIAPETYLKRAIVGGFTKVFEFARCFRNEGMDATHLQDFTMLEGYCAYYSYKDTMRFLQELLCSVARRLTGSSRLEVGGRTIDFSQEWPAVTFRELLYRDSHIDIDQYPDAAALLRRIGEEGIELQSDTPPAALGRGNLIDLLYKKVSRPQLHGPVFLTGHPVALSPLARASDENPALTDRFQLIIDGAEIINGYSELVDPQEQRQRLQEQALQNARGDGEAMVMDEDYLTAMEYGMPPISGWGMGIDRALQVMTGQTNIRDCVMFPLMRPLSPDVVMQQEV